MFIHLTHFVDHGTIDNRHQGIVDLKLWFDGVMEPMEFRLEGDCLRDMAGCLVNFKSTVQRPARPLPFVRTDASSHPILGIVGDMTASKRQYSDKERKTVCNYLYLEWETQEYGLFVIDDRNCEISISLPSWTMNACDEQAQIMCNQQMMRDYVEEWIRNFAETNDEENPLPDHPWDVRLREAEGTAIAYQEIHQKYSHAPCGEICEAFVMGWDARLGKLADSDEMGTVFACHAPGALSLFDILNEDEAIEAQLCMTHPLFQKILSLTEMIQRIFPAAIVAEKSRQSTLQPEILQIFSTIRYITPNIFSCLLQLNEGEKTNYSVLSERLARCAYLIDNAISAFKKLNIGNTAFEELFLGIHRDTVSMSYELSNQVK